MPPVFAQDIDPRWFNYREPIVIVSRVSNATLGNSQIGQFIIANNPALRVIDEILALQKAENFNGYTFQPSDWAVNHAMNFVWAVRYLFTRSHTPTPKVIPDGEGGIDLRWKVNNKLVNLSVRANDRHKHFIYWKEQESEYDGKEAGLTLLRDKLTWLMNDR